MRKTLVVTLLIVLVLPTLSFARNWHYGSRGRYRKHYRAYPKPHNVYRYRSNGGAIAAGVLGGIVTGVILDRLLTPPQEQQPQPACCQSPASYYAPAPVYSRQDDPYYQGYQQGYQQGVESGRTERYQQGRQQGYDQGLDDAASGRIWTSTTP